MRIAVAIGLFGLCLLTHTLCSASENALQNCSDRNVVLKDHNATVRVCRSPDIKGDQLAFVMGVAVKSLPLMEELLGESYDLKLLNIVLGVPPEESARGIVRLLPEGGLARLDHELIHGMSRSFWSDSNGPSWFVEGTSNFATTVIRSEVRFLEPRDELDKRRAAIIRTLGAEANLPLLAQLDDASGMAPILGELLLIDLYYFLGPENLKAAFRDLSQTRRQHGSIDTREIIQTLDRHCPDDIRCRLWDMVASRVDDSMRIELKRFWVCTFWPFGVIAVLLLVVLPYLAFLVYRLRRKGG